MTVTLNRWVALVGLVTAIGCAGKTGSIQGSATYRERMVLPSTAVFEALLEDVSRADAAAEILARTRVPSPGNPPIAFTLEYDPARVRAGRRYVVRGRVLVDGQLLFTTDTAVPVMPGEDATPVSLLLRRVGAAR